MNMCGCIKCIQHCWWSTLLSVHFSASYPDEPKQYLPLHSAQGHKHRTLWMSELHVTSSINESLKGLGVFNERICCSFLSNHFIFQWGGMVLHICQAELMLYKSQVISRPRGHHPNEDFTPIWTCLQFDSRLKCTCLTGAWDASGSLPKCRYVSFINFRMVSRWWWRGEYEEKGELTNTNQRFRGGRIVTYTQCTFGFICKLMI